MQAGTRQDVRFSAAHDLETAMAWIKTVGEDQAVGRLTEIYGGDEFLVGSLRNRVRSSFLYGIVRAI